MFDQDALTISSVSEMSPTAVICFLWARDSFCVAHGFWLPCYISRKSWILAILWSFHSFTSRFISKSFSVPVVFNAGLSPASIPLLARLNSLTATLLWRVLPVIIECLQLIMSCPREKLASTPTPCGMIHSMPRATFEWWAYCEWVSSGWRHQSVISGIQNLLLISNGSEWYSFRFGLPWPKFIGDSGAEFKWSLVAVNKRAARTLHPGVVSARFSSIRYSSASLDQPYGSKDNWPDPEDIAEGKRIWLGILEGSMTENRICLALYSFSTYFRKASWYWVL